MEKQGRTIALPIIATLALLSGTAIAQTGPANSASATPPTDGQGPPPPPRHPLSDADTNGDGKISRAELEQYYANRFAELDSDGDGRIPVAELQRREAGPDSGPNANGERRGPPPGGGPGGPPPGGAGMGAGMGGGRGGPPPGDRRGPPPGQSGQNGNRQQQHMPRPVDANEDGFIDRAEFLAVVPDIIAAWDSDGDGQLTIGELPPPPPPPASNQSP